MVVHYIHELGEVSGDNRGYHAYMNKWTPVQDEILRLIPEPANSVDRNVVAEIKDELQAMFPLTWPHYLTVLKKECEQSFC